jgi:hypothetical protein
MSSLNILKSVKLWASFDFVRLVRQGPKTKTIAKGGVGGKVEAGILKLERRSAPPP